jgi:hypothetical protein
MIEIWTEVLPKGWEWSPDNFVGGTHEFVVNTAICSLKYDDVIVYYDGRPTEFCGVYYLPRSEFRGNDIVLACNHKPPVMGGYNIAWCNWFDKKDSDYKEFDERIVQSPYHKSIFGENSRLVPLSLWPEQFKNPVKVKKQCLYSSSPDRGGKFLKEIWPEVEERTGAKLITTYKASISEKEMIDLYKSSQFWLHPCQGIELFCVAAAKAQVAGCIPVVVPNMALETTVKYGVKTTLENYKEDLIKAIENPPQVKDVDFGTWQTVTDELFKNIKG